ncbi:hypothetical protein GCM10012275_19810 [Longimycelium tulufanense]|uniref:Peptidase inhibitor family I36 n=1 Tax=Longimycelium tulufanense TaxID=907463 RepID=A0A8J3CBG8_9PSEU|nr:peptidase inhibitor family I36 protein [Longimycelium tulufanense]GGM48947.1 hypothetical protein GCM10012275_19810 [Longimycelium tulufanense]
MHFAKKWKTVVVAALALAPLTVGTGAQADTTGPTSAPHECTREHICFWKYPDFRGRSVELHPGRVGRCQSVDLHARSVWNNSRHAIRMYVDHHCRRPVYHPPYGDVHPYSQIAKVKPSVGSFRHVH